MAGKKGMKTGGFAPGGSKKKPPEIVVWEEQLERAQKQLKRLQDEIIAGYVKKMKVSTTELKELFALMPSLVPSSVKRLQLCEANLRTLKGLPAPSQVKLIEFNKNLKGLS